jgi:Domain of unknown function (DUF4279)
MYITLALCVVGEELDPQCVTNYFGISPTEKQKKGDLKPRGDRPPFVVRKGAWSYSVTQTEGDWESIDTMIKELDSYFNGSLVNVPDFTGATYTRIDLLIQINNNEKNDGAANFKLGAEAMQILAKTNLPLEFTVYIDDEETD